MARSHLQLALAQHLSSGGDLRDGLSFSSRQSHLRLSVVMHGMLALATSWAGYLEQGLALFSAEDPQRTQQVETALEMATILRWYQTTVAPYLNHPSELLKAAEKLAILSRDQELPFYRETAQIMRGYAVACCGDVETGRVFIQEGLRAYLVNGAVLLSCQFRAFLAETYQMLGDTDTALHILAETLQETERTGERWYDADLYRRVGETQFECGRVQEAEHCCPVRK